MIANSGVFVQLDIDTDIIELGRSDRKTADRTDGFAVSPDYTACVIGVKPDLVEMTLIIFLVKNTRLFGVLDQLDHDILEEFVNRESCFHFLKRRALKKICSSDEGGTGLENPD